MSSAFLDEKEVTEAYGTAQDKARYFFENFDEYERLMANKLRTDLPANMPKVNDGSYAGMLMEMPMRVFPELKTGKVKVLDRDEAWLVELANIRWNKHIVPNANAQAPFLTKFQNAIYRAGGYGSCPMFSFFDGKNANWSIPYIRDVYLEPGKTSDLDSDYIYMNQYYTKMQIQSIIKVAEDEAEKAKAEGRKSDSPWILKPLKDLVNNWQGGDKDSQNKNSAERNKAISDNLCKIVFCFQRGVEAPFDGFIASKDKERCWRKTNTNPTGDVPITLLYSFQDLINPYGKGQTEISGPTQNVLDYLTQSHVLATQIGLQPPIEINGPRTDVNLSSLTYSPRAFWFTGSARVTPVKTNSDIYNQFGPNYGLYKTQLQNLQGTSDATVSGESGNPQYSKTDAGVKLQQARTNAHDNYLKQRCYEGLERLAKNLINIDFANMQGTDIIKLADDERERMEKAGIPMPDTNELTVIWDNVRAEFDFEVDAEEDDDLLQNTEKDALVEAFNITNNNPNLDQYLQQDGKRLDRGELLDAIFTRLKLPNVEKILVPIETEDGGMAGPGMPQDPNQMQPPPTPPQPDPQQEQLQQVMEQYGLDEGAAMAFLQAQAQGIPEEAIVNYLTTGHVAGGVQ